jgi:cyclic lactone autoinducer peptide
MKRLKRLNSLRKYVGTSFAFMALVVAQVASTQFSFIFYQDSVPESVKALNK